MFAIQTFSNLNLKGFKNAIKEHGKYVLLYLYDGFREAFGESNVTRELFSKYGRQINNGLGSDFSLLTVYDKSVITDGFMGKDELRRRFTYQDTENCGNSEKNHYKDMERLSQLYGVRMPVLILVDTEREGGGVLSKQFEPYDTAATIYEYIKMLISAIRDNYGDWEEIKRTINIDFQYNDVRLEEKLANESLEDIVKTYMRRARCTQKDLAEELGISERQLRRYLHEWEGDPRNQRRYPIPRDKAIAIAYVLRLTPEETDKMFDATMAEPIPLLGTWGRDGIIRQGLRAHKSLAEVNDELSRRKEAKIHF